MCCCWMLWLDHFVSFCSGVLSRFSICLRDDLLLHAFARSFCTGFTCISVPLFPTTPGVSSWMPWLNDFALGLLAFLFICLPNGVSCWMAWLDDFALAVSFCYIFLCTWLPYCALHCLQDVTAVERRSMIIVAQTCISSLGSTLA